MADDEGRGLRTGYITNRQRLTTSGGRDLAHVIREEGPPRRAVDPNVRQNGIEEQGERRVVTLIIERYK